MKKMIAAVLMASFIAISAAGCGYNDALEKASQATQQTTSATQQNATEDETKVSDADYKDNFEGLCSYMMDKGYYTKDTKTTEMDSSFIGAKQGIKYSVSNELAIEFYEYDTKNLNDKAKKIVNEVKSSNSFTIIEGYPVNAAYLSNNGKYLMIYNSTKIDKDKPDENSQEYKNREQAVKDFLDFKN